MRDRELQSNLVKLKSLGLETSTGRVGLCFLFVLCPGAPEGSTGRGSDFKASQKTGPKLKVSSNRLGEAGNRTC